MVDTATVLAALVAERIDANGVPADELRRAFAAAQRRELSARIYELTKTRLDLRVHITDDGWTKFMAGKMGAKEYLDSLDSQLKDLGIPLAKG